VHLDVPPCSEKVIQRAAPYDVRRLHLRFSKNLGRRRKSQPLRRNSPLRSLR
jgi:hypothetical protein